MSYPFKVGKFEGLVIKTGGGPRDAAGFLPDAPPDELEKAVHQFNLDPKAVEFSMNVIFLKTGNHNVLIDTGIGMIDLVSELGVDAGAVDTIVITHGHGDHVGGITTAEGALVFPNARYLVWKSEWDYWTAPDRFTESDSGPGKRSWQVLSAHRDRVTTVGGEGQTEADLIPGLRAVTTFGHTIGHIGVLVESDGQRLLDIADAAHAYFQMARPEWSPGFDYDKKQSAVTRAQVFDRAAREHLLLIAYHFPFPGMGHVVESGGARSWQAV